jgi:hypothetical protein
MGVSAALGRFLRDRYLSVDPRSLGLFRIALGTLLCVDVLTRWRFAREFFSNEGLLPNHYVLFRPQATYNFSIYHAFSSPGEVGVAFALTLAIFLCLLVGFRTRLASVLALVCVTSLGSRNLLVEHGGDVVANLLMLFASFLPLGRRFSVDAVLASLRVRRETRASELNELPRPVARPVVSLAVLALLLQWSALYFLNATQKTGQTWAEGSALHYFFQQDRLVTALGLLARELPTELVRLSTTGSLALEYTIPVLLLFPFFHTWTRRAALLCAVALHGGIALTTQLWHFSAATSVLFLMFLGPKDWALAYRWFGSARRARRVTIDSGSPLCLGFARVLSRLDPCRRLVFADGLVATVLVEDPKTGSSFEGSSGLVQIGKAVPLGFLAAGWLRLPGIGAASDRVLAVLAARRPREASLLGIPRSPRQPAAPRPVRRRVAAVLREATVVVFLFAIATQMTIDNPFVQKFFPVWQPRWVVPLIEYPRLYQGWLMFAPNAPYMDGRLVVNARTIDGRLLDPLTGRPPDFGHGPDAGWRRQRFWIGYEGALLAPYHMDKIAFLESWVRNHHLRVGRPQDELVAVEIWWVADRSPPPGEREPAGLPPRRLLPATP